MTYSLIKAATAAYTNNNHVKMSLMWRQYTIKPYYLNLHFADMD